MRLHPDRTPGAAPVLPGRRRALAWGAGVLGVGVAAVVVHNARRILSVRRAARSGPVALDHTALVGEGLAEPLDLVVLGDSAAAGYGNADPREAFPFQVGERLADALGARVRIDALARSGATTHDVPTEQVPQLAGRHADVVVVSVGVNDALGRRRSRTVRADQAAAAAAAGVVFAAYPRPPEPGMFGPDGLHPGPAGQRAAADMVVAVLDDVVRPAPRTTLEEQRWTSA